MPAAVRLLKEEAFQLEAEEGVAAFQLEAEEGVAVLQLEVEAAVLPGDWDDTAVLWE